MAMKNAERNLRKIILLLFAVLQIAFADIVAVLEIIPRGSEKVNLTISEFQHLTDELRKQARETLPRDSYSILTRDNITQLIPAEQAECLAESCAIDIGRAIGADYVAQGFIGNFDGMLTLTVELYESVSGNLLGSFVTESENVRGLLGSIRKHATPLFTNITNKKKPTNRSSANRSTPPAPRSNPASASHLQFVETSSSRKTDNFSVLNNTSYYEEEGFGLGERTVAVILNIVPGLGSYLIMDDFTGVVIQWGLISAGALAIMEFDSPDLGGILMATGYLSGFIRPIFYDKPKPNVKVISSQKKSNLNMALLPNKHGNPKAYLLYNRLF